MRGGNDFLGHPVLYAVRTPGRAGRFSSLAGVVRSGEANFRRVALPELDLLRSSARVFRLIAPLGRQTT